MCIQCPAPDAPRRVVPHFYPVTFTDAMGVPTYAACLAWDEHEPWDDIQWLSKLQSAVNPRSPDASPVLEGVPGATGTRSRRPISVMVALARTPHIRALRSILFALHDSYVKPTGHWRGRLLHALARSGALPRGALGGYVPVTAVQPQALPLEMVLQSLLRVPRPLPGQCVQLCLPGRPAPVSIHGSRACWPHVDDSCFCSLFSCLRPAHVARVLAALLLERPVLLHSSSQWRLQSIALALTALLAPLHWAMAFIPVLPEGLMDMVEAPVPRLIGVTTPQLGEPGVVSAVREGGLVVVALDGDRVDGPGGRWGDAASDAASVSTAATSDAARGGRGGGAARFSRSDLLYGSSAVLRNYSSGSSSDVAGDVRGRVPMLPPALHIALVEAWAGVAPSPHGLFALPGEVALQRQQLAPLETLASGVAGPHGSCVHLGGSTSQVSPGMQAVLQAATAAGTLVSRTPQAMVAPEGGGAWPGSSTASVRSALAENNDGDDMWANLFSVASPHIPPLREGGAGAADAAEGVHALLAAAAGASAGSMHLPAVELSSLPKAELYVPWGGAVDQSFLDIHHGLLHSAPIHQGTSPQDSRSAMDPAQEVSHHSSPSRGRSNAAGGGSELQVPGDVVAGGGTAWTLPPHAHTSNASPWVSAVRCHAVEAVLQLLQHAQQFLLLTQGLSEASTPPPLMPWTSEGGASSIVADGRPLHRRTGNRFYVPWPLGRCLLISWGSCVISPPRCRLPPL